MEMLKSIIVYGIIMAALTCMLLGVFFALDAVNSAAEAQEYKLVIVDQHSTTGSYFLGGTYDELYTYFRATDTGKVIRSKSWECFYNHEIGDTLVVSLDNWSVRIPTCK